jgi:hypothetical protein
MIDNQSIIIFFDEKPTSQKAGFFYGVLGYNPKP